MIVSNLIGGIGNQMFQYAVGRAMALARDCSFKLDISGFSRYRLHGGFELERIFNCPVEIADASDLRKVLGWQGLSIVRRALMKNKLAAFRSERFVVEPHFHYWPGINKIPSDCYLHGYWQSEKYFGDIEARIRDDFVFRQAMTKRNANLAEQIEQENSVSLHIRRGDYVSDRQTAAIYGECTLDYYKKAIQYIAKRVERPSLYIFSDDIQWAKCNIETQIPCRYVDHNKGPESYNDMRLMSLCRHNIIANSTFSWWAAWLNSSPHKLVVAPVRWFANSTCAEDLLPGEWIKL